MKLKGEYERHLENIRAGIARKETLSSTPAREKRLAFDRRMLAAGERLVALMMPSGRLPNIFLSEDMREFLRIYNQD